MMDQNANCSIIEVTEDEVENCVRSIPKLDTLILVKVSPIKSLVYELNMYIQAMVKKRSFANPFPGLTKKKQLGKAGRSNSVPGVFHRGEEEDTAKEKTSRLPSLSEDLSEEEQRGETISELYNN